MPSIQLGAHLHLLLLLPLPHPVVFVVVLGFVDLFKHSKRGVNVSEWQCELVILLMQQLVVTWHKKKLRCGEGVQQKVLLTSGFVLLWFVVGSPPIESKQQRHLNSIQHSTSHKDKHPL